MIRRPLQGSVGQDQIRRRGGLPGPEIALHPVYVVRQGPRLYQHGGAGIQPMHLRIRPTPLQQGRVLARTAADVPDFARRQIVRKLR